MKNLNKKSLVIFGYSEMLSLALVVKSKIVKVKKFKILQNDEDQFFGVISSFIPYNFACNNVYYSCGPGGFTTIRKIISFVKALNFVNCSKIKFIGLNHLFIIAFYLSYKYKINDQEYILSILNYSNDNFVQIFQRKKNSNFFLENFSNIRSIDLHIIENYLKSFNLSIHNINLVYLGQNNKYLCLFKNILLVNEANILQIIAQISILIENNKLDNKSKKLFEENFKPLYGKLPSTN